MNGAAWLAALAAICAGAADQDGPAARAPDAPIELSLEACVQAVLSGNVTLRLGQLDTAAQAQSVIEAFGAFDPELYASASTADREEPTASSFQAPRNQSVSGAAGLRGLLRSGMTYDLGYTMAWNKQSPSNPFFGFNPTLSSDLTLNLTQPLLRGFGATANEQPVEQARLLVVRADLDYDALLQETVLAAIRGYWTLYRSRAERSTAQAALEVAEELVRNNQRRLDAGVMTRLDVLTAQAEAARRREALIRAQNSVGRDEDALKLLLSPGAQPRDWQGEIVPTSAAGLRAEPLPGEEEIVLAAFETRSDLRALEVDLSVADLELAVAGNRRRPRLDLVGSYGYGGLDGDTAGNNQTNRKLWADTLAQIRDREFDQWSVGLDFARPIGNRSAEAAERRAGIAKERAVMALLERRMAIVQELRTALRDVADAQAAYEAAMQARILAEEQYQAEIVRLENEHSTTFQVREAQRDLFEARDNETAALIQYEILFAGLERARGDLARRFGVEVELETREAGRLQP